MLIVKASAEFVQFDNLVTHCIDLRAFQVDVEGTNAALMSSEIRLKLSAAMHDYCGPHLLG